LSSFEKIDRPWQNGQTAQFAGGDTLIGPFLYYSASNMQYMTIVYWKNKLTLY